MHSVLELYWGIRDFPISTESIRSTSSTEGFDRVGEVTQRQTIQAPTFAAVKPGLFLAFPDLRRENSRTGLPMYSEDTSGQCSNRS
jgi:hypothetical protein